MIPFLVIAAALAMFAPDQSPDEATPGDRSSVRSFHSGPADTVFVVIYRHLETEGQPFPMVVDDSVHVYEARP